MNDLLKINFDTEQPTVSARDLHEALGIRERFSLWFSRYADVFENGADYQEVGKPTVVNNGAKRVLDDYLMSTDMAKHISMMTKTEKGKIMRQYFIDLEKAWNTPEQIMARALKMANQSIESLKDRCKFLGDQVIEQQQIITELQPKANYVDTILQSKSLVTITQIAKDYGMSGRRMNQVLKELKIQYKVGGQWVLYSKYQNTILFETTEILRCVRKSLEERMSKEDADKWIDKVVRRSAMTEKEEIIDSIKGVKDGLKKLKEKLGDEKESENSDSRKDQDKEPVPDFFGMLLDVLLDGDGKDQEG